MSIAWRALGLVFLVGVGVTVAVVALFSLGVTGRAARADAADATTDRSARAATTVTTMCFTVCALVVGYGVYLIIA